MIKISEILEIGSNKKYIDNLIKECKKENSEEDKDDDTASSVEEEMSSEAE